MHDREKVYRQFYYGDSQKSCKAERIVYAIADEKQVHIHFMRHDNVMDVVSTNETSLLQMLAAHPGSFVHSNRHIIIRKRFLLSYGPQEHNPKQFEASVRFVNEPLEISRRRIRLVRDALIK